MRRKLHDWLIYKYKSEPVLFTTVFTGLDTRLQMDYRSGEQSSAKCEVSRNVFTGWMASVRIALVRLEHLCVHVKYM